MKTRTKARKRKAWFAQAWAVMRYALASCLLGTAALGCQPALGCSAMELTFDQLCREAWAIVHGFVTNVEARQIPERNHVTMYTYYSIDVAEVLKGDVESRITIRSRGGCLDDNCVFAEGIPYFQRADEVILFLQDLTQEHYLTTVYAAAQGEFIVERDELTGTHHIRNGFGLRIVGVDSDTNRLLVGEVSSDHRLSPNPDLRTVSVKGCDDEVSSAAAEKAHEPQAAAARITKEEFINAIRGRVQ